ncbi:MAG: hypothetical protein K1X86_13530 [Ignavibacteria bacterium]|nr:hypothetical protein [Ignavibacteria bacterium]
MKYIYFVILSLFIISGCGKSQMDLEKERIEKEAADLKKRIDSMSTYINKEKQSLDSGKTRLDSLSKQIDDAKKKIDNQSKQLNVTPKKLDESSIKKTDELVKPEKTEKENK